MSDDSIPPALTPQQWDERTSGRCVREGVWCIVDGALWYEYEGTYGASEGVRIPPDDAPTVAALANTVLPDGDPRKITRADVTWLRLAAGVIDTTQRGGAAAAIALHAIADKLAALLPPEGRRRGRDRAADGPRNARWFDAHPVLGFLLFAFVNLGPPVFCAWVAAWLWDRAERRRREP